MLNTEPIINVPIDHSVAIDVKEGDYFGINVKYAKKAGSVENLPEIKTELSDADVVKFSFNGSVYEKQINHVKEAEVARYDIRGRKLADLVSSSDIATLVQESLSTLVIVQSINGKSGNVSLIAQDIGLGNVDNTRDLDKPVSTATEAAIAEVNDRIETEETRSKEEDQSIAEALAALTLRVSSVEQQLADPDALDLSNYYKKEEVDNIVSTSEAALTSQINTVADETEHTVWIGTHEETPADVQDYKLIVYTDDNNDKFVNEE